MANGILVINDNGHVAIDENYKNLAVAQKVTGTTSSPETAWYGSKITFSFTGSFPMIAWQCSEKIMMQGFYESSGTWHFVMRCSGPPGTAYTLFVFAEISQADIYGDWGLEVWNAAGERTFHSDAKIARIAGSHSISLSADGSISYTAGREYATAMLRPAATYLPTSVSPGPPIPPPYTADLTFSGCRGYSGGVAYGSWLANRSGPYDGNTPFNQIQQPSSTFLVLDVTDF